MKEVYAMVEGLLKVLLYYSGLGLMYLGYGKKGMAAREVLGKGTKLISFSLSVGLFIWLFGLIFFLELSSATGVSGDDILMTKYITFGCPMLYVIWFIIARCSVTKLIGEAEKIADGSKRAESNV